ncbi:hypothetical protein GA0070558_101219 [Micromonospora haikouensis]|uniref:DUF4352 domain-containing protein n=1 Tax=Micromonospora haikouensis TaxID=686309 RepID=A0A1C4TYR4_9ACTN|nr:hypothetical protein [Micromonospora haikouensis]SCE64517.1 hypothetical protein GA0070558_101219 [Micromonospora haikouensis]
MPASRRHHRALAVFVHCLGILAAVPALPTVAPKPVTPAATTPGAAPPQGALRAAAATMAPTPTDTATPTGTATPAAPAPPPLVSPSVVVPTRGGPSAVTVAVTPAGTPAPGYQVQVRNASSMPVATTVRQELPPGTSATWVTPGGRTSRSATTTEVTWQLRLPPRSTTTLHTALTTAAPGRALSAPACAFAAGGDRPYDCATATWDRSPVPVAQATDAPAWRRPAALLAALAGVFLLTAGGLWWWQRHRRARATAASTGGRTGSGGAGNRPAGAGTVYAGTGAGSSGTAPAAAPGQGGQPRPVAPVAVARRRRPPVWLLVGAAAAVLAGVVLAATLTATRRVAAIDTTKQPSTGAWVGTSTTGVIGMPLREQALEFTVYRIACPSVSSAAGRQCQATVGVRNLTPEQQTWHGEMQRAYLPGGTWVSTDEAATRLANQGRDVFGQPLAAGSRLVLPLVFTVDGTDRPRQLELRSGVFSAGVRVDVP